tara:strand:+ start:1079 stop:2263 length:1185 start_codon:yes stop_codon:yes gene_type:complete
MIFTLFEGPNINNLNPISVNHASFEILCGAFNNLDRIKKNMKEEDSLQLIVRDEISDIISERYPNDIVNPETIKPGIWVNGSMIFENDLLGLLQMGKSYTMDDVLLVMGVDRDIKLSEFNTFIKDATSVSSILDKTKINYLWDALYANKNQICYDSNYFLNMRSGKLHASAILVNDDNIFIADNAEVCAGCVLDATEGPIIVDEGAIISIGSMIEGPVYIGKNSKINSGSKIKEGTSIGPVCKIGGEVENSIFQGYSNKQHDGFVGHSYIGEWVNLGANTNTSDLKNNYNNIRVEIGNAEIVETENNLLGSIVGDYVKTGISTMLNTGTYVGIGSVIFGSGFQKKRIEPFSWGDSDKIDFNKFIDTTIKVKERRNLLVSDLEKKFLYKIYNNGI